MRQYLGNKMKKNTQCYEQNKKLKEMLISLSAELEVHLRERIIALC